MTEPSKPFSMNVSMQSRWDNAEHIQSTLWDFIQCAVGDSHRADCVSMVGTELVENALKYGDRSADTQSDIEFSLKGNAEEIIVEVTNRVGAGPNEHVQRLDETIQWIRGYQNPFEAYVERLKSVSKTRTAESMLGMVRIAYEGSGIIDFYLDDNDNISVSATIPLT